jgi:MGT family glycosyltransferase
MSRILVVTPSATAHVSPFATAVQALAGRGHEVFWYTGTAQADRVRAAGATYLKPAVGVLPDFEDLERDYPQMTTMSDAARGAWFVEEILVAPSGGQYRDLAGYAADLNPDVVLADSTTLAAGLLHEVRGIAWATLSVAPAAIPDPDVPPYGMGWKPGRTPLHRLRNIVFERLGQRVFFRKPVQRMNEIRAGLGLPPVATTFAGNATPYLYLQATAAEFEYHRPSLAGRPFHFVGPLFPPPPRRFDPPPWWPEVDEGRPVIVVTQGTSAINPDQLVIPAVEALADADALVVVTGQSGLGPLPANVRVASFLPYQELLPRAALLVTNGGYGTVQLALAHSVPIVAAGMTEDKPEVCARVEWAGAGIYLRTSTPKPDRLRAAVNEVMSAPAYRAAAGRLSAAFARHDAPAEIADLVEQLIVTGAPVVNRRPPTSAPGTP